jgi:hypothetical protein
MHQDKPHTLQRNRFSAIDQVSDKIFDRFDDIAPDARNSRGESEAISRPVSQQVLPAAPQMKPVASEAPPAAWAAAVEAAAQELLGTLIRTAAERPQPTDHDLQRALIGAHVKDIGPDASRRRAKLPDGIDLLKGAPSRASDEALMASIRSMMTDQKRDFSLRALPALEPPVQDPKPILPTADGEMTEAASAGFFDSVKSRVIQAFAKDFTLAANVAFWGFLALFLFLDPHLSLVLFGNAVFVLLAVCFVFMPERLTDAGLEVWKRILALRRDSEPQDSSRQV